MHREKGVIEMVTKRKTTTKKKSSAKPKTKIVYRTRTVYKEAKSPVNNIAKDTSAMIGGVLIPAVIGIGVAGAIGKALQ
jgi:sortase (surface protein transpeptidase)